MIDTALISPRPWFLDIFTNTGVSKEATVLQEQYKITLTHLFVDNESIEGRLREGFYLLQEVAEEYNELNWDGYGALSVSENSLENAKNLVRILPTDIPLPEIEVDPDGEVSFDWYNDADDVFSVSIGETGKLAFAGMFGRNEVHGVEHFYNEMPGAILFYLRRMLDTK